MIPRLPKWLSLYCARWVFLGVDPISPQLPPTPMARLRQRSRALVVSWFPDSHHCAGHFLQIHHSIRRMLKLSRFLQRQVACNEPSTPRPALSIPIIYETTSCLVWAWVEILSRSSWRHWASWMSEDSDNSSRYVQYSFLLHFPQLTSISPSSNVSAHKRTPSLPSPPSFLLQRPLFSFWFLDSPMSYCCLMRRKKKENEVTCFLKSDLWHDLFIFFSNIPTDRKFMTFIFIWAWHPLPLPKHFKRDFFFPKTHAKAKNTFYLWREDSEAISEEFEACSHDPWIFLEYIAIDWSIYLQFPLTPLPPDALHHLESHGRSSLPFLFYSAEKSAFYLLFYMLDLAG